jgi:hypothetical protein
MKYRLIKADSVEELELLVNTHMGTVRGGHNWRPLGGVNVRHISIAPYEQKTEFVQAMTCNT